MRLSFFIVCSLLSASAFAGSGVYLEPLYSGETVYTSYGQEGTLNGVFNDGTISVNINGFNSHMNRADIAGPGCSDDACSRNATVTRYGQEGTINGIFPSGQVSVKINGFNSKMARSEISIAGCMGRLCTGQTVTTKYGQTGTINGFFQDGNVSVKINGFNSMVAAADLAPENSHPGQGNQYNTHRRVRTGEQVFTRYGQEGTVNGVFSDRQVSVSINGFNSTMNRDDLAVTGCVPRMCSGDSVTTKYGQTGTINGFFMNDDVSVKINGFNSKMSQDDLAVIH